MQASNNAEVKSPQARNVVVEELPASKDSTNLVFYLRLITHSVLVVTFLFVFLSLLQDFLFLLVNYGVVSLFLMLIHLGTEICVYIPLEHGFTMGYRERLQQLPAWWRIVSYILPKRNEWVLEDTRMFFLEKSSELCRCYSRSF